MTPSTCLAACRLIAPRSCALATLSSAAALVGYAPPTTPDFVTANARQPCRLSARLATLAPCKLQNHLPPRLPSIVAARYASVASDPSLNFPSNPPPLAAAPYRSLTIGVPRETYPGERRVAITPTNVKLLLKKGFARILVERGAGSEAQFTDEAYEQAGAETVDRGTLFSDSDIVLKVRAPTVHGSDSEVDALREGATIISFLYPNQNQPIVDRLALRKATSFAMDMVPRISRAQAFDALRFAQSLRVSRAICGTANPWIAPWQISPATRRFWRPPTTLVVFSPGRSPRLARRATLSTSLGRLLTSPDTALQGTCYWCRRRRFKCYCNRISPMPFKL